MRPPTATAAEAADIVIFGGTGDLAFTKLLPALFQRDLAGLLPSGTRVIAISRRDLNDVDLRVEVHARLRHRVGSAGDSTATSRFLSRLHHVRIDLTEPGPWHDLAIALPDNDRLRVFYLAAAPHLCTAAVDGLVATHLVGANSRVVLEKPIGHDLASARKINDAVGAVFTEDQIFRVDHYLGKETVQSLLVLRFANSLFESQWNSQAIDHVQISVSEKHGVGGRVGYYEGSGALRDMVQNHLLQLLCLIAMEPPSELRATCIRDEKLKVLLALRPTTARGGAEAAHLVRGQYTEGYIDAQPVPGYRDELETAETTTETFFACRAEIDNWRWSGVPFYLRTGKRLARQAAEIVVQFKQIPHSVFPGLGLHSIPANRLVFRLQPDDGVHLEIAARQPGSTSAPLESVTLNMNYTDAFRQRPLSAYERILADVLCGDQTLFMSREEVESAWAWTDSVCDSAAIAARTPLPYPAGSDGPESARALIEGDGRQWYRGGANR